MKEIGIYIHIPFCKQKCYYCDFCSFAKNQNVYEEYIDCLLEEINNYKEKFQVIGRKKNDNEILVKTIYIGGGTPSIIDEKHITRIIEAINNNFNVDENAEITIEVNPGTATKEKLEAYYKIGINRISIGLQSANDRLLNLIGRIHNYEQFEAVYKMAKEVGFSNINVDLMIDLPTQSLDDVEDSLKKVINLKPQHISVYSLILEEGTVLEKKVTLGELVLPDDEIEREMYWFVKNTLETYKYNHYEISNFSLQGYESKHNSDCWNQKEYIGFGLAAHSYLNDIRFSNTSDLDSYINNMKDKFWKSNIQIHEIQSSEEKMNEYVILKLRTLDGISCEEFYKRFNIEFKEKYKYEINYLEKLGLIEEQFCNIKLSNRGLDFANIVWEEFA